jgi:hypothetical protein
MDCLEKVSCLPTLRPKPGRQYAKIPAQWIGRKAKKRFTKRQSLYGWKGHSINAAINKQAP